MKIEGRVTLLVNKNGCMVDVRDKDAGITFLKIDLTPDQFIRAMSRESHVECELDIVGLDKIGKKLEVDKVEIKCPDYINKYNVTEESKKQLQELAQSQLTDGWIADGYFESQDSFFYKGDEKWARVTIRRWV